MFNYSSAFLPTDYAPMQDPSLPPVTVSDCLFIGGDLHDQVIDIPDYADRIYVGANAALINGEPTILHAIAETHGIPADYLRYNESNVFADPACTTQEIEEFIAIVDSEPDLEAPDFNDSVLYYVAGMKDACERILSRFACPNCQPQFS